MKETSFLIPSTLQDLEREPYNLDHYPDDFDLNSPSESFEALVEFVLDGNYQLVPKGLLDRDNEDAEDSSESDREEIDSDFDTNRKEIDGYSSCLCMPPRRLQALYTLVRKSTVLKNHTRKAFVDGLCQAIRFLSDYIVQSTNAVGPSFRDSFTCHVYMLYSTMVIMESSCSSLENDTNPASKEKMDFYALLRRDMISCMVEAAHTIVEHNTSLWSRGVINEDVILLPIRIAYRLLEKSKGVNTRKVYCGDQALQILNVTLVSKSTSESTWTTIIAALIDLMHSFEHMASLCCELCVISHASTTDASSSPTTARPNERLAVELLREVARAGCNVSASESSASTTKASGIAFAAPFVPLLAAARPRLVLQYMPHLLPVFQSLESYQMRSALVQAIAHLSEYLGKQQQQLHETGSGADNADTSDEDPNSISESGPSLHTSKSREALLDILIERAYDVSSYTRAAGLKAWIQLSTTGTLPITRLIPVTLLAMDRLQDKTVVVRKQAMHLLTILLENHPFLDSLNPKPYRQKLDELYSWVKMNFPEAIQQVFDDGLLRAQEDNTINDAISKATILELEQAALSAAIAEADSLLALDDVEELSASQREYCNKIQALKFTQSALDFIDVLEGATVALESMLCSANASDVVEALRFFVQAHLFEMPCAVAGMKRALALLWASEPTIRDEVLKSFIEVFIASPGSDGQELLPDQTITKNLLLLTMRATVSELTSIEEAIQQLVHAEAIPPNVFLMLWSLASSGSAIVRAAAIRLLAMGASADASIVDSKSRLKLLLDAGLSEYCRKRRDWRIVGASAICLQRIDRAKVDLNDMKYLVLERIIEQLQVVACGDWCDESQSDTLAWFPAGEQAVKAIFMISPEPEHTARNILLNMYQHTFLDLGSVHPLRLARFFHVLGQISLQLLVYTESLCTTVRRANAFKSLTVQEKAGKVKSHKRTTSNGSVDNVEVAIEAELGIAAEAEAENERDMLDIAEKEIVGRGLIGEFVPLLVQVVANEGNLCDNSQILSRAATLALVKLMCVSSKFCEDHLNLLFTAIANAPSEDTTLRANTAVALGDLAFRFPNEVEPYTPHLYACLRDPSTKVRRHTLMVLTHLILNDMVRVKGQVCEIALCLQDEDPRIRDMSRLLFHELSKRTNNPIYNLIPDIISSLGQNGSTKKGDFRSIMSFLLGFIKKDRQNEMLVDKLCQRFPTCAGIAHKADLAYCLSQLKMNEKTIKCLNDQYKLYKDALHNEDVHKSFLSIVVKAKKQSLNGVARQLLEDWEAKIVDAAAVGAENELAEDQAAVASKKVGRRKQRKNNLVTIIEDEAAEAEDVRLDDSKRNNRLKSSTKKKKAPTKGSARKNRHVRVKRTLYDSSEELSHHDNEGDDSDEEEVLPDKENKKEPSVRGATSTGSRRSQRHELSVSGTG